MRDAAYWEGKLEVLRRKIERFFKLKHGKDMDYTIRFIIILDLAQF